MGGPKDKKPGVFEDDDLDNWASAIDEWDTNLKMGDEEPPALGEIPKAPAAAPAPKPQEQPLQQLFGGEVEAQEEYAGEALGEIAESLPAPPDGGMVDDTGFEPGPDGATRVASSDEF